MMRPGAAEGPGPGAAPPDRAGWASGAGGAGGGGSVSGTQFESSL